MAMYLSKVLPPKQGSEIESARGIQKYSQLEL